MKKEYYIQGNPARADQIKAAFKRNGIDTSANSNYGISNLFYFSCNGEVAVTQNRSIINIIKTHPDYQELELPTKHKFNVGDWIVHTNGSSDIPIQVYGIKNDRYLVSNILGSKGKVMLEWQDKWRPWTIADAKDGDVLVLNGKPFIYSHNKYGKNYCYIDDCGQFRANFNLVLEGNCVCPATKQERDLLFSKMREVGYEWDEKKKELRKIIETSFKVGDWVVTDYGKVSQVVSVDKDGDGYTLDDGVYFSGSWCNMYHLWTIEDAKDGDVLATDNGWYCIFKAFDGWTFSSYCFMDSQNWFCEIGSEVHTPDSRINGKIHPATKEQRDLLFAKMREEGYEWDVDKKELRKIIEPKFKVGNWITDGISKCQIHFIDNTQYWYSENCILGSIESVNKRYHLWTIADAKDGDVLACYSEVKGKPIEQVGIFKQYVGRHGGCSNTFLAHTGIDWDGNIIINGYIGSTNIHPATPKKRDQFFKKMREAGYEWDADKKELHKIQHYDIANFQPFDKVLIRVDNNSKWTCDFFSYYHNGCFHCVGIDNWSHCIPFEGNEHLLGTTDMPSEEYINW